MRANFNWKLALLVVILLPILCRLGFWQAGRAEEKSQIIAAHEAMLAAPAVELTSLNESEWQNYRQVSFKGEFLTPIFLLDNQLYQGQFGYEVIQPVKLDNEQIVMVSRGWVKGDAARLSLPQIERLQGSKIFFAYLYYPSVNPAAGKDSLAIDEDWPKVIQSIGVEKLYKLAGINDKIRAPFLLRLDPISVVSLKQHWQLINVSPEKHWGYAFQWFGMAFVLLSGFLFVTFRSPNEQSEDIV